MKVDIEEVALPLKCWVCEKIEPSFPGQMLPVCATHLGVTHEEFKRRNRMSVLPVSEPLDFDPLIANPTQGDPVNNPIHYTSHPSGIEEIEVSEHMTFCLGNVIKYVWRAGLKGNKIEDLRKAQWYLNREIERIEKERIKV
jgi:hypothetical protein